MINQELNRKLRACRPKRVGPLVHKVIYGADDGDWSVLFKRVQNNTAINLRRQKARNAEDRRICWTTHKNTSMWFNNWEEDIVALEFGTRHEITGKVHIPPKQLRRIGNFDKTCLSLNGSSTVRDGHPDCIIYNPRFPVVVVAKSKSSLMSMLITGSTASGKVFPPHIQFQSKAKTADTARIDINVAKHTQQVLGKFGCDEVKTWPITFGTNEKGGMDNKEFLKYMRGSIVPLFPDAVDQPGCRVLLKVNSGPGRMNLQLLATLKLIGIILYPCIPNTMHMTHETDQFHGPFKTQFLKILDKIVKARLDNDKSLLLAPKMVGLPLFRGIDWETRVEVETGAFQKAFVPSHCLAAWRKVGAATEDGITRACLNNLQVMKEIRDGTMRHMLQSKWQTTLPS
jgi:hypothetical protein